MKDKQHHKQLMATLRSMKPEELAVRERDLKEELFGLVFKARSGQLEKTAEVRKTRRMIARIKTIANGTKERSQS
ncbi:MAG: 50S ribosomal protein L29 [Pseudomonadota bacterium]